MSKLKTDFFKDKPLEIERNLFANGYSCFFPMCFCEAGSVPNDDEVVNLYYATINKTKYHGPECRIFTASDEKNINLDEMVYQNQKVTVSIRDLINCIKDFKEDRANGNHGFICI